MKYITCTGKQSQKNWYDVLRLEGPPLQHTVLMAWYLGKPRHKFTYIYT